MQISCQTALRYMAALRYRGSAKLGKKKWDLMLMHCASCEVCEALYIVASRPLTTRERAQDILAQNPPPDGAPPTSSSPAPQVGDRRLPS